MGIALSPAGGRHAAAVIVIPVIVALLAMAATVGGFLYWSTSNSDARAVQRQTALIDHTLRSYFALQAENQESWALWSDAVDHTHPFDAEWVDENLGAEFYESFGYEQTVVLDGEDHPIYLMRNGRSVDPTLLAPDLQALAPLLSRLRADIATGALRAYLAGGRSNAPYAADYAQIAGTPAMVTVMPIADPSREPDEARQYLHVAIDFLDEDYASYLGEASLVEDAAFRLTTTENPEKATLPLINASGRIIAFLEWRQDWPGRRLLAETVPALAIAMALATILFALLVERLYRYSMALEAGRARAEHEANHDALTGLPNRACFERRLGEATAADAPVALFALDLDRFKQVNDTLGHPAGDELIRMVGARLAGLISSSGLLARMGGDEFSILEPAIAQSEEAFALAARIVEAVGKPFDLFGNEARIGVSVGIALSARRQAGPAEMARRADIALYEAKGNGRNCAMIYEPGMEAAVNRRRSAEPELRENQPGPRDVLKELPRPGSTFGNQSASLAKAQ
ncbi:diguanylate cyclase domain-containing protein [Paradevosia shaoguanensis]|uniref:Diguanylate cyclase n=1 Tax=Paradevosia shaoguanensis TaxID=1335043 RepID=A0AA41UC90_9HYPH|nr:diguanylate cyclase [Paradevosia shaoguanensis]MCF1743612.1 diguanylate cyclase [Paradevosia shaoguanensis]MCI0128095.1 diguanylate cyclase [Paradevosia shaoguanensis]